MANSRLEILGSSGQFSINKMTTDESQNNGVGNKPEEHMMYEESYSYASQDSHSVQYKNKRGHGSPYQDDSSSLDSAILMRQIQSHQNLNNNSESVYSSDQTRIIMQSPSGDENSSSYHNGNSHQVERNQSQFSQYSENNGSQFSNNSSATYVVKKDNDEALIMTSSSQQNLSGRHKRGSNIQSVLEDISNSQIGRNSRNQTRQKQKQTQIQFKKLTKGKENKYEYYNKGGMKNDAFEIKSHSFTSGNISAKNKKINSKRRPNHLELRQEEDDEDDELDVRFINDIDSLVPPKYNPDTRTYFKCSIYSPSNRLYTVNEEANSTQSDLGAADQFSSSLMNSGFRKSTGRGKIIINGKNSAPNSDRHIEEYQNGSHNKIDEEDEDDEDAGNISESMIIPATPRHKLDQYLKAQNAQHSNNEKQTSQSSTGAHTRTNSSKNQSKAQSLRGSIIVQKPISSHFSSVLTAHNQNSQKSDHQQIDKRTVNRFLRETFTGILPSQNGMNLLKGNSNEESKHDELGNDINEFIHQMPGSFVCTGGTEFQYETSNAQCNQKQNNQTYYSNSSQNSSSHQSTAKRQRGTLSIEKTKVISKSPFSDKQQQKKSLSKNENSPVAYYDENNRKVLIISNDPHDGDQVQHCIKWDEDTDPGMIGKVIEDILVKVKNSTSRISNASKNSADRCKVK